MAVIMKIREKLGIVVVFVIALAIVAFLLMDSLSSNSSLLSAGATNAGVVNGREISIQEFENKVQEAMENYRMSTNQANIDEQTVWMLRNQTWEQYINEVLMKDEYERLGIQVTPEELLALIQGPNPHPAVVQSFSDPQTGQFDPNQVMMFLQRLDDDQTGETRARWLNFEKFLKEDRLKTKFNMLIKKGVYVPTFQAKEYHQSSATTIDFQYVYLPYSEIGDESVSVSDEELKKYISNNKGTYKQEESRTLEYVSFDILPTTQDTVNTKTKLTELKGNFKSTANDSIFIKLYSDRPFSPKYWGQNELQSSVADTFFAIDTNTIIGPYLEEGAFVLAKLLDRKLIPDSVKARHIFLSIAGAQNREDVQLKRSQADTLVKQLNAGGDFEDLVLQYSDDEETKFSGGNMGWIKPGQQYPTIDNALFYKKEEGDIFFVPSDAQGKAGFHVIEITEAEPTKEAVKVAFLTRKITPSIETERNLYAQASEFAGTHSNKEKFKSAEDKYTVRVAEGIGKNDNTVFGIGASRDLVKWAYEAEQDAVSEVFSLDDKYVVALVSKIKEEGPIPLNDIRTEVEVAVKKQKKAEKLKEKIQSVNASGLEGIANALNADVDTVIGMSFNNNFIPDVGLETGLVNKALDMKEGEVSKPIAGNNGVFVVKITDKKTSQSTPNYSAQKQQLRSNIIMSVDAKLPEAIKETAEIQDERYKFY